MILSQVQKFKEIPKPQEIKKLSLKEKLHLLASTIRNNAGIEQGFGHVYDEDTDKLCVYGLLGYRAGVPKQELNYDYDRILAKYGITLEESRTQLADQKYNKLWLYDLWVLNDNRYSFDDIADVLDKTADRL